MPLGSNGHGTCWGVRKSLHRTASCHVGQIGTNLITELQAALGPVITWRGDRSEYAVCCCKVLPHLMAWVREGSGITLVKSYNSTTRFHYSEE
jgi:hypothetical protein